VKERIARSLEGSVPAADPVAAALEKFSPGVARVLFPEPLVDSAVLVPVVLRSEGPTILLTLRTDHLRDHPGQIGFPGGRVEPGDAGPLEAAMREVEEELGLAAEHVEIAGYLDAHAVVTGFAVTPVVGFIADLPKLRLDPFEVAEVFEVPLEFFLDETNLGRSTREIRGVEVPVFEYLYGERRIWGATAHMLRSFTSLIR
jgi:8-oxo-dGTP pyrophosphatase MutT (NUDIX family)